ncbi:hypothetical protein ACC771_16315, partial [Rhizobium ruizarguesonis]
CKPVTPIPFQGLLILRRVLQPFEEWQIAATGRHHGIEAPSDLRETYPIHAAKRPHLRQCNPPLTFEGNDLTDLSVLRSLINDCNARPGIR